MTDGPSLAPLTGLPRLEECADRLKTLADDSHLELVRRLLDGPRSFVRLQQELALSPSALQRRLQALCACGLVQVQTERPEEEVAHEAYSLCLPIDGPERARILDLGPCRLLFRNSGGQSD